MSPHVPSPPSRVHDSHAGRADRTFLAPPFGVRSWRDGGDARLDLCGELDIAGAATFKAALDAAEASDAEGVVVDLRGLEFIDVGCTLMLLDAQRRLDPARALLTIPGPPAFDRILRIAGLRPRLHLVPPSDWPAPR